MFSQDQQIVNGPALAIIEYIRSHHIGIDVQRLEALEHQIRLQGVSVSPEFVLETRRVREELKRWLQEHSA